MNFVLGLSFLQNLVVVLFILICCAIVLIVLLQKGRGGGIGAAFGGGAGSLLGTKTGDFLTWVTICLVAAFLVLAVLMGKFLRPEISADLSSPGSLGTTTQQPTGAAGSGETSVPLTDIQTQPGTETAVPQTATPEETPTLPETEQPGDIEQPAESATPTEEATETTN